MEPFDAKQFSKTLILSVKGTPAEVSGQLDAVAEVYRASRLHTAGCLGLMAWMLLAPCLVGGVAGAVHGENYGFLCALLGFTVPVGIFWVLSRGVSTHVGDERRSQVARNFFKRLRLREEAPVSLRLKCKDERDRVTKREKRSKGMTRITESSFEDAWMSLRAPLWPGPTLHVGCVTLIDEDVSVEQRHSSKKITTQTRKVLVVSLELHFDPSTWTVVGSQEQVQRLLGEREDVYLRQMEQEAGVLRLELGYLGAWDQGKGQEEPLSPLLVSAVQVLCQQLQGPGLGDALREDSTPAPRPEIPSRARPTWPEYLLLPSLPLYVLSACLFSWADGVHLRTLQLEGWPLFLGGALSLALAVCALLGFLAMRYFAWKKAPDSPSRPRLFAPEKRSVALLALLHLLFFLGVGTLGGEMVLASMKGETDPEGSWDGDFWKISGELQGGRAEEAKFDVEGVVYARCDRQVRLWGRKKGKKGYVARWTAKKVEQGASSGKYENPPVFEGDLGQWEMFAKYPEVKRYTVDEEFLEALKKEEAFLERARWLTLRDPCFLGKYERQCYEREWKEQVVAGKTWLYLQGRPDKPEVGDVRVRCKVVESLPVTLWGTMGYNRVMWKEGSHVEIGEKGWR